MVGELAAAGQEGSLIAAVRVAPILERNLFAEFLSDCEAVGVDQVEMRGAALSAVAHHAKPKLHRNEETHALQERWYASVAAGKPDWDVYASASYIADLWACWVVYSRQYLRSILSPKSMPAVGGIAEHLRATRSVADLGCGLGYTTGALAEMFPRADVITGTNLDGIAQTEIARRAGARYGFRVVPDITDVGQADLVFASEYFEHLQAPIDHLVAVLDVVRPKALLVANAFTAKSIGHFDFYRVAGKRMPGDAVGRAFGSLLRTRGYRRIETKLWNSRPTYWVLA